jgi:hypothetical protein
MIYTEETIAKDIYRVHETRAKEAKPRAYVGGSAIGRPCSRALWYSFRGVASKEFDGRMLRLFETGHLEEPRMISELRQAGYEVVEGMPNGRQFRVEAFGGHFAGHLDGLIKGVPSAPTQWHVVDFKTANRKSFDEMERKGIKEAKPEYWAQAQVYVGLAPKFWPLWALDGEPPNAALYIVRCKDTERLYAERIPFDAEDFNFYGAKAKAIIDAKKPPEKISEKPDYYICRWCDFSGVCHGEEMPRPDCRTCVHATPEMNGNWHCARLKCDLKDFVGCPSHLFMPPLVERVLGRVKDYDRSHELPRWIEYESGARNSEKGEESSWRLVK